jgi:tRNA-dihydrouridine synthase A
VDALIVHARKAWLDGLSPRENRDIPPLDYDRVYRLKRAWPKLHLSINGGIASVEDAAKHLGHVDGVMMGRAAYQEPWRLLQVDRLIYGASAPFESGKAAIAAFIPYVERELAQGTRLHAMTRHVLSLFHGVLGARAFRRHIATHAVKPGAGAEVLRDATGLVIDARAEPTHIAA